MRCLWPSKVTGNRRWTPEVTSETPLIIMYTAGTTGKPKGAVLTQGNCLYNALNLQVDLEFTSSDRNLVALPMFHIGGIGLFTLPMLYVGGTVVIQRAFDPARDDSPVRPGKDKREPGGAGHVLVHDQLARL